MKYVSFAKPGGPEVLEVSEAPEPSAGKHEVAIAVEAAGVSRADALQRRGLYPPPAGASNVLGLEVAGIVKGAGPGVDGFHKGDRVVALCNGGGYADVVVVPYGQVLPLPDTWSFVEGATLPENAFTVYDNLMVRARLTDGETLLVHGGTSGIGTTAIMFAEACGARTIATAGTDEKCAALRELGVELAINYKTRDFAAAVMEYTSGRGADVVLDIVGGDYIDRDLRALAVDGRIACIATAGGEKATIDLRFLLHRRATLLGSSLRPRSDAEKARIANGLRAAIWPLLDARDPIVPIVDSVYTFSQAAEAHARLESSEHVGKIVLVPDAPAGPGD